MPTLSRQDMERIIVEERGSVLVGGRIITKVDELPSEADLAGNDPVRRSSVREALTAQRAALEAQIAALDAPQEPERQPARQTETGDLATLKSVDAPVVERLRAAGITNRQQLRDADDATLLGIEGIGEATVRKLREEAK